jgi:hypothetical protein
MRWSERDSQLDTHHNMGRRLGNSGTITVVVPRQGTPAASKQLQKFVANEVKKTNRVFQGQEPLSGTELHGLVSIKVISTGFRHLN